MMALPGRKRAKKGPPELKVPDPSPIGLPGTFPLIRTAEDFRRAAVHIFSAHGWLKQTSRCMGVDESTVWRWASEQTAIKAYALAVMSAWLHVFLTTGRRPPEIEK